MEPVWNEKFVFEITRDSGRTEVVIELEDDDFLKNEFMGRIAIPLSTITVWMCACGGWMVGWNRVE